LGELKGKTTLGSLAGAQVASVEGPVHVAAAATEAIRESATATIARRARGIATS
jgi:hypothetical protein